MAMTLIDPIVPREWWRDAVVYQIYVRSFADSDGDGVGDLPGITSRLPYLRDLGVDAVWLTPFYTSPQHDHGYDVADYYDVDPLFGSLGDADELLARAHDLGLKVIVDLVPNHTSHAHAWFQAALAAEPGSPERARYLFRDGRGPKGDEPPNNWQSIFGGPAWTQLETPDGDAGQWYLHLFDSTQPDLDWRNPEVGDMFEDVLRFWLDRGVDGFRVDVAHGLFKEEGLRDQARGSVPSAGRLDGGPGGHRRADVPPARGPRRLPPLARRPRRVRRRPDDRGRGLGADRGGAGPLRPTGRDEPGLQLRLAAARPWSAASFAEVVTGTFSSLEGGDADPTWVLSNHDVVRHATRYGGGEQGQARARAALLTMLALPGSTYLYQGEELGLEQVDVAPEHRQDPSWFRTGEPGRDGCRVPMPWHDDTPPFDFGPGQGQPWIPQPAEWAGLTVAAQAKDPGSMLNFYRAALSARRAFTKAAGRQVDLLDLGIGDEVLAFRRGDLTVVLNCGPEPGRTARR